MEYVIRSLSIILDNPKSVNFICPSEHNNIFSGLISLYIIPSPCKYSKANIISAA